MGEQSRAWGSGRGLWKAAGKEAIRQQRRRREQRQNKRRILFDMLFKGLPGFSQAHFHQRTRLNWKMLATHLDYTYQVQKLFLSQGITGHFNEHPRFKEDPRFSGLFDWSHGCKRAAPVDAENQPNGLLPQDQKSSSLEHSIAQRCHLHSPPCPAPMCNRGLYTPPPQSRDSARVHQKISHLLTSDMSQNCQSACQKIAGLHGLHQSGPGVRWTHMGHTL